MTGARPYGDAMVIFYRGAGWAMVALAVAAVVVANRLINGTFDLLDSPVTGTGFVLAGIAVVAGGWYVNMIAPRKFQERLGRETVAQAMGLTQEQFEASEAVNPGLIEASALHKTRRNYNTLLFIPIQIWGLAMIALGVWFLMR